MLSISGRVLPPFRIIEKLTESILTCESLCKQQQCHRANKKERYCYLPSKDIEIQHIQMHLLTERFYLNILIVPFLP